MIRNPHTVETRDSRRTHVLAMKDIAVQADVQRERFIGALQSHDGDYALAVKYGKHVAAVDANGQLYEPKAVSDIDAGDEEVYVQRDKVRAGVHPKITAYTVGAAPANKIINGTVIPCGVCAIVAGGGAGKTPLAHELAAMERESYSVVRVGEPLAGYTDNEADAAFGLAQAFATSSDIVLDSVKDAMSGGGSLMKSGISRDLLTSISSWSTLGCEVGATLYVPINPSVDDPDVVNMMVSSSKSNATMAIVQNGARWEFWARQGEGLPRSHGYIDAKYDAEGNISIKFIDESGSKPMPAWADAVPLVAKISATGMNQAMRRSLTLDNDQND